MEGESRPLLIPITAIAVVVVVLSVFVWPGIDGFASSSGPALFDEELVQSVYERVSPAVVEIYVDDQVDGDYVEDSSGSGFLIDSDGLIATNNHVVEGADRIRVVLLNGQHAEAELVGNNPANDLALIRVDSEFVKGIDPVELGDSSQVRPGQMAIIIGSPFGLQGSVSVGVSSGINRGLPSKLGRFIPGMIQTDALVNPGNSGGPLLNSAGEVVGIVTAVESSPSPLSLRSVGFAVPINILVELTPRLIAEGTVQPPWLGTLSQGVEPLLAERLELPVDEGFYVIKVMEDSPAHLAGLIPSELDVEGRPAAGGDIIVEVSGTKVYTGPDLTTALNGYHAGDEITLTVIRDNQKTAIPVTLGHWPGSK